MKDLFSRLRLIHNNKYQVKNKHNQHSDLRDNFLKIFLLLRLHPHNNPDYNMINSRFCVRDVKTEATLTKHDSRYYWKLNVNNYDIFDKLVEKVSNIMPIINCSEVYEKDFGIALTTEKMKVKMILDYYWNLLDKERRESICEKVRNALRYL